MREDRGLDQRATHVPAAPDFEHDLGERYQALREAIDEAEKRLSRDTRGYLIGRTEPKTPIARNRQALDMAALRPRVLLDGVPGALAHHPFLTSSSLRQSSTSEDV